MRAVKDKDPLSMFKWTVKFHNEVNTRLNKPVISVDNAVKMWNGEKVCLEDCSGEQVDTPEEINENETERVMGITLIRGY